MPIKHDDELAAGFGRNLAEARKRAGYSQESLAWASGLHRTQIGKLEAGERVPRIDTLLLLAQTMKVDPAELLKGLSVTVRPKERP